MSIRNRLPLLASLIIAPVFRGSASAQPNLYEPGQYITQQRVRKVHDTVQKILGLEKSPISMADARRIVTTGTLSGLAQRCELPWEDQLYLPMMAHYRQDRKLSEPQMRLVGLMHGVQQATVLKEVPDNSCPQDARDRLAKKLRGDEKS